MKKLRGILVFVAALAITLSIVSLQLAWNLRSPQYLQGVAEQAGTNAAVAVALPDYAASKLPNAQAANDAFSQHVSPGAIRTTLDSLYTSIAHAYAGKTDVVEIDITAITVPVLASGYQIPPGTVFASDAVQVGGLASVLRTAQKGLLPTLVISAILLAVVVLLGIKRGITHSLRLVLLVTCLLLGGLFLATLVMPSLIGSLVSSSGLDASLRSIVLSYVTILISDAGRYYLSWIALLMVCIVGMSIVAGVLHHPRRSRKRQRKQPVEPPQQSVYREL